LSRIDRDIVHVAIASLLIFTASLPAAVGARAESGYKPEVGESGKDVIWARRRKGRRAQTGHGAGRAWWFRRRSRRVSRDRRAEIARQSRLSTTDFRRASMAENLEQLKDWIGQKEGGTDYVTVPLVERLAATLDLEAFPREGEPLPVGWHMALFPRVVRQSQVGRDGHPERGDFLPPVPLPRRMFAGRRVTFRDDLLVGEKVHKQSEIANVTIKEGRTGKMVFVTVRHDIHNPRGLAIVEEQDIVYRDDPDPNAPKPAPQSAARTATWAQPFMPEPVVLFRFSAVTFNGHRIHYDHPYVTDVEGYEGLVQNGGLTTLLVSELARLRSKRPIRSMTSRNVRPLFANHEFMVCGEPSADGSAAKMWVADHEGALALSGEIEFA
jgi:3-methylfumaryl-CoA hydratase